MNLWQVMEKYNRIIGTLINSTVGKNELPGKILSFNSDKLFSKQNKTATEESYVLLFYVYSVTLFFGLLCQRFSNFNKHTEGLLKHRPQSF